MALSAPAPRPSSHKPNHLERGKSPFLGGSSYACQACSRRLRFSYMFVINKLGKDNIDVSAGHFFNRESSFVT
ncbi:hypothetical protein JOC86_001754 [Bacillus pakistanensis]|uniref:Yippee domain-containing protein n=1 Tax=Rossellomorea pakistanensis TaxID=992288 RepID=A0ABS2NBH1_9BACI|nr:hypothetical protein [Bacillus pakistanensis]